MARNQSEKMPAFPGLDPEIVESLRLDVLGDAYAANAYFLSLKDHDSRYHSIPLAKRGSIRSAFRQFYAKKSQ